MKVSTLYKEFLRRRGRVLRRTKLFYLVVLTVAISGCEKIIDVDLNEVDPVIVIEGNLSGYPDFAQVKVSKTSSYFNDTQGENISGANIFVETDFDKFLLPEVSSGLYRTRRVLLFNYATYKLTVEIDGKTYTATSKLKPAIPIDSLSYFYQNKYAFFENGYAVKVYFIDPANEANYYRIKILINGKLQNDVGNLIIFDDRFVDGQQLQLTIREIDFSLQDTVTVQLISLDEKMYEYYRTLEELLYNNPGSAAPANPTSNITNGALGYFSAWSYDNRSIIIKE